MAVKIRLKQTGKRNSRAYRIVVVDESKKRDGKVLENLGFVTSLKDPKSAKINTAAIQAWVAKGAQLTESVAKLIN